jgi:protein-L-isoaspartate O-methyltransferase
MLAAAAPKEDDKVLIVTNGSDYLAEVLRPLVGTLTGGCRRATMAWRVRPIR